MAENLLLRTARKRKHWTQTQAAEACLVDLQTYFRWEHCEQEPRGYNLERLCQVFRASMEDLGYGYAPQEEVLLEEGDSNAVDHSKRNALRTIAATAGVVVTAPLVLANPGTWERLVHATTTTATINQDTIQHFNSLLSTSKALSNGSELHVASSLLDTFLPRLQEAAPFQAEVAGLTSQALLLKSIFVAHDLQVSEKIALCQAAVEQAKRSTNPNLIAIALLQLGVAYTYAQQQEKALKTQQEALYFVNQVSPLVQSHIYTELSATLAQFGRAREADFYINFAYETFPQSAEQDPSFTLDDHWSGNLALYKGIMYIHLAQPKASWEAFEEHKKISQIPERIRLEIINHQGRAALALGDLEKYAWCLESGLIGAITLRSQKRYNEAVNIFSQEVPTAWQKEPPLRVIKEQYSL